MGLVQDVYVYRFVTKDSTNTEQDVRFYGCQLTTKYSTLWFWRLDGTFTKKHIREHCILHSDVPNSFVCTAHDMTSLSTWTSETAFLLNEGEFDH